MILKEVSVERFAFTCRGCRHACSADYDIQHVEDDYGHARDYFFRDGVPCANPTGPGITLCPRCGRNTVDTQLTHRRASPAVPLIAATRFDRGERPTAAQKQARASAPMLPGEQPKPGAPSDAR